MFIVNPKNYRKSIGKLMQNNKNLTASLENYLKAIFNIVKEKKAARVKDISKQLNIGASSVSEALRTLSERNLINYEPYGIITLTEAGLDKAEALLKRHDIIKNFFENVLSVSSELSEESASQVEHVIPDEVMKKFVMFLTFMDTCSCKEPKWIKSFKHFSQNEKLSEKCVNCISKKREEPELSNKNCCGMTN